MARFRREAEAAARLRHPNIVPIHDVGWRGEVPYLAMEYVEGGTLARRLAGGPIPPDDAARLVETLARAVQHAHDAGVVHRDLKPANILLAPDLDHPKIGDFGLAKLDDDSSRTGSGVLLGTPNYMSPEQAGGDPSRVGPSTDIHALGAILYESLAGRPPFRAASILETLEQVRQLDPPPPRRPQSRVPRDLETIALKCLEKSPGRRYSSAGALADDLRRHLEGETILARAASPSERLAKWARRRPWQATSAGLGVVVVLGTLAGTLVHNARLRAEVRRTEREAEEAQTQRSRAEDQYRSARDAIRRILGRLDEPRFAGKPLGGELGIRRQLLEDALAFYEGAVRDDASAAILARLDKVEALLEAATFRIMLGETVEAEPTLRRALGLLDALEAEGYRGPDVFRSRVAALNKLGLMQGMAGRFDESLAVYRAAIEEAERSPSRAPADLDNLAWGHHNLASALLGANRPAEAVPHLVQSSEIRRGLLRSHPEMVEYRSRLAGTLTNLANVRGKLGDAGRAEAEFAEAAGLLAPIVRDHSGGSEDALALGKLCLNWGWMGLEAGQLDRAIDRFRAGLEAVEAIRLAIPDWPEARQGASQLHSAIAMALGEAGRHRQAVEAWDRAIALANGDAGRTYRLGRLASLARDGDGRDNLAEARELAADPSHVLSGLDLYNLACVAAVVASAEGARSPDRAEAAALQAIRWLERSLIVGAFRDRGMVEFLDRDPDLGSLRPRADFRLFRLDAAFPPDPFQSAR